MSDHKSLGQLAVGESAILDEMALPEAAAMRLQEMGLLPGTSVTVRRVAPLGDPLELEVRGACLSIRKQEASLIAVDKA